MKNSPKTSPKLKTSSKFCRCVVCSNVVLLLQCGRKPLLLLGFVGIGTLLVVAGILIQLFDLEESTDLNGAQKVAGYFVIVVVCLQMSIYGVSFA